MPAKKSNAKKPLATPPPVVEAAPHHDYFQGKNGSYYEVVQSDIAVVTKQWPTIVSENPLPLSGSDGFQSLVGFGAPFDANVFDSRVGEKTLWLQFHGNFMWQDFFRSVTPWIPLLRDRVEEYGANHYPTPMAFKTPLVFHTNFTDGAHLPKGGLERISPDVPSHALPKGQGGLKLGGCQHAE